jgi:processive 1,2-diacylglycerol beta-glucosyltransferase
VSLRDRTSDQPPDPDVSLVPVLQTTERALLPLAESALTEEGIDYSIETKGLDTIFGQRTSATVGETEEPFVIVVRAEDASRARELLDVLASGPVVAPGEPSTTAPVRAGVPLHAAATDDVALFDAATGAHVGSISNAQFETLSRHLERESSTDDDYYLTEATLDLLAESQVDPMVVALLRQVLAGRPGMDLRWVRTTDPADL